MAEPFIKPLSASKFTFLASASLKITSYASPVSSVPVSFNKASKYSLENSGINLSFE